MEPIDEELDESMALAAGRVPSSLSQMSHLQSFVRRSSFEGRRYARPPAPCTRPVSQRLALGKAAGCTCTCVYEACPERLGLAA